MSPLLTIASAARLTMSAETAPAKQFQLFQPIGGVNEMRSPHTKRRIFLACPLAFWAPSVTAKVPALVIVPVMSPVCASTVRPAGNPAAEKVMGLSPVAGIVKRTGEPGRTPKTLAPLMRGVSGAG